MCAAIQHGNSSSLPEMGRQRCSQPSVICARGSGETLTQNDQLYRGDTTRTIRDGEGSSGTVKLTGAQDEHIIALGPVPALYVVFVTVRVHESEEMVLVPVASLLVLSVEVS